MLLKKFMEEKSDYVGAWGAGHFYELEAIHPSNPPRHNQFYIHVESRESKNEGLFFTGRGEDRLGTSKIEGIITQSSIEFTKQYCKAAIQKGAVKGVLNYGGVRVEHTNKQNNRVVLYAGIITSENWQPRTFIMKNFS